MLVYVSLLTEGFLKTLPLSLSISVSSHSSQLLNGGVHTQRQRDFWSGAKFCSCSVNKTILFYQCSSQSVPLRESRKRLREGPHQKRSRAIMALSFVNSVGFPSLIPWAFLARRSYPKKDKPDKRIFEVYQKFFLSK